MMSQSHIISTCKQKQKKLTISPSFVALSVFLTDVEKNKDDSDPKLRGKSEGIHVYDFKAVHCATLSQH
jgi:hypothetical protein